MRLPAVFLLAATLLFWGLYDRYEPVGPELLKSPALADAFRVRGDCSEADGRFTLRVEPGGKSAGINFSLPGGTSYGQIRVRGRMRTDGVGLGDKPWRSARLVLIPYDADGKWMPGHHIGASAHGTQDWTWCEEVFEIDQQAARLDFCIQQLGTSGEAEFDQLSAVPVRLRSSFIWYWVLFVAAWVIIGSLYYKRGRLHQRRLRRLILLNAFVIFAGTLMPGHWLNDTAEHAKEEAVRVVEAARHRTHPQPPAAPPADQRTRAPSKPAAPPATQRALVPSKLAELFEQAGGVHGVGHFTLFASLCFLVYCSAALERQHKSFYFKVAGDLILFAALTESMQFLTIDRTPGVSDWLIDLYGVAAALILFLLLKRWIVPRENSAKKDAF